jgi:hypothetical protein
MDYGMMRSFMTSGSLTWGTELDEGPDRRDIPRREHLRDSFQGMPPWWGGAIVPA